MRLGQSATKRSHYKWIGLAAVCVLSVWMVALADSETEDRSGPPAAGLIGVVRRATDQFRDPAVAIAAGYANTNACVSGPQEGAMGVHFVKGELVGDGQLDPQQPEALLYEPGKGRFRLLGVEYIVLYDDWHATNEGPPLLMGHQMNYVGSPNRYGLPAFYELHVWAWENNPNGAFADWNPKVSCANFVPDGVMSGAVGHTHGLVLPGAAAVKRSGKR